MGGTPNNTKDVHPVGRFNAITNVLNIARSPTLMKPIQVAGVTKRNGKNMLRHQIFSKREWRHGKIVNHPEVNPMLYHSYLQSGSVNIVGVADTGAQSDL